MNFSIIRRTLGWLLLFEGIFFHLPLITAAIYWEAEFFSFLICIGICAALGGLCFIKKPKNTSIFAKEGFVIVALSWIVISLIGALPFVLSGAIPSYVDALFETVSGFTTTGATILNGGQIDGMAKSLLMWRSFTHWVGGMGVLVLIMAFLPLSGARNMHMMKAESPGPVVGKIVPKVKQTAIILYAIYSGMTVIQLIMLLCGGVPLFEALTTSFATAGTGGFFANSQGVAGYNLYVQIVVTVFMALFSINFNSYYLIGRGKIKDAFNTEVRAFLAIFFTAVALIALDVWLEPMIFSGKFEYEYSLGESIQHAFFYVSSIISTTGFGTVDYTLWPVFSQTILVVLMFIGACAGSTGGGIKVSRIVILSKAGMREVGSLIQPNRVKKITMDHRPVSHEVVRSVTAYFIAYIAVFALSTLLVSFNVGIDFTTNFSAVASTLNNVGPGLSAVGPMGNFSVYNDFSKFVFIFDMLAGRLEIFPMLILFAPITWKK